MTEQREMKIYSEFPADLYWEWRYSVGGDSGSGSVGDRYRFKRDFLNALIRRHRFSTVVDFGCGDGRQVAEIEMESYYGLDISSSVIRKNRKIFASRPAFRFDVMAEAVLERYDLALSLDVLYHVVEKAVYENYLKTLFAHSDYTLLYCNRQEQESTELHIVYRDHFREMERLGISSRLLGRHLNPGKPSVGFFLYQNTPEPRIKLGV